MGQILLICAIPAGTVGQFGDVNVNPLSVPASIGSASTVRVSVKCPFGPQRSKLSKPTNQSGEGTNLDIRETWKKEIMIKM